MAEVCLTRGMLALVDDADMQAVQQHRWFWQPTQRGRGGGYAYTAIKGRTVYMHRLILTAPDGVEVDHANGDGCDNRRQNLRLCSHSLNMANQRSAPGVSGYRGVHPTQSSVRPFTVKLRCGGVDYRAGRFADVIDAAKAYDDLAIKHFGPFASLNFPEGGR